jgi:lipoate-protein ligase A
MNEVVKALDVKMSKIESKGHKSVRSRVANISEFLKQPMDIETFRSQVLKGLYEDREEFETYHLTEAEWKAVHQLKDEKYGSWDWNFGNSPKFNIQRTQRFPIGEIDLRIDVEKGHIKNLKIYGDFFGSEPVEMLEDHLIGSRYDREALEKLLHPVEIENYFGTLAKNEFLELVYGEDE